MLLVSSAVAAYGGSHTERDTAPAGLPGRVLLLVWCCIGSLSGPQVAAYWQQRDHVHVHHKLQVRCVDKT